MLSNDPIKSKYENKNSFWKIKKSSECFIEHWHENNKSENNENMEHMALLHIIISISSV